MTWQINGYWQYDSDADHASEVDVQFTAQGDGHTRIDVVHDHLERLVAGQELRDGINGGGWSFLLDAFAAAAATGNQA